MLGYVLEEFLWRSWIIKGGWGRSSQLIFTFKLLCCHAPSQLIWLLRQLFSFFFFFFFFLWQWALFLNLLRSIFILLLCILTSIEQLQEWLISVKFLNWLIYPFLINDDLLVLNILVVNSHHRLYGDSGTHIAVTHNLTAQCSRLLLRTLIHASSVLEWALAQI